MPAEYCDVAELYRNAFSRFGRSSASVLCPKGRQHIRYAAMLAPFVIHGKSVLDFGCGLGDLYVYLSKTSKQFSYTGADLVNEFIQSNSECFPEATFRQISTINDLSGKWDIILASGVFNIRYKTEFADNRDYVFSQIEELFAKCVVGLTVDFLSAKVDFQADRAFHVSAADVLNFALDNLGRRAVINHSYLPFEYSLTVFKDEAIDREGGVYRVD